MEKGNESLEELYIAENEIQNLSGLSHFARLKKIHARDNLVTKLDFEEFLALRELKYLNLRNNQIDSLEDLKIYEMLESLENLNLKGNFRVSIY